MYDFDVTPKVVALCEFRSAFVHGAGILSSFFSRSFVGLNMASHVTGCVSRMVAGGTLEILEPEMQIHVIQYISTRRIRSNMSANVTAEFLIVIV